jgi:hypothetical protein
MQGPMKLLEIYKPLACVRCRRSLAEVRAEGGLAADGGDSSRVRPRSLGAHRNPPRGTFARTLLLRSRDYWWACVYLRSAEMQCPPAGVSTISDAWLTAATPYVVFR